MDRAISDALGPLLLALQAKGFRVGGAAATESFGNFEALFSRDDLSFTVVRDRGQLMVGGVDRSILEPVGLWRAFSGHQPLAAPLLAWLESIHAV